MFNIGDRVKLTKEAIQNTLIDKRSKGALCGEVVGYTRCGGVRIIRDGLKTPEGWYVGYLEPEAAKRKTR